MSTKNMYNQAEKDDDRVRVFTETATVVIPKTARFVRIKNNQTRVCIVAHKALAQFENMLEELRDQETFVMLYRFKSMNGNAGVTLIQSCINYTNHEVIFHNDYKDAEMHFIQLMKTAAKTTDRNIIYYGARNEG
jgi:hypothetical protein